MTTVNTIRPIFSHALVAALTVPVMAIGGLSSTYFADSLRGFVSVTAIFSALATFVAPPGPIRQKFIVLSTAVPLLARVTAKISDFVWRKLFPERWESYTWYKREELLDDLQTLINAIGVTALAAAGWKRWGYNPWAIGIGSSVGLAGFFVDDLWKNRPKGISFPIGTGISLLLAAAVSGAIQARR